MLASSQRHKNHIFIGSWILVITGAFFAYFDILPPEAKKVFGYVWLVGVVVQLLLGASWTIDKYRHGTRHKPTKTESVKKRNDSIHRKQ
jgi:hypothetical protein